MTSGEQDSLQTPLKNLVSFRRKADAREIGSHDNVAGEPTRLDRFAVIRLRQRTAGNLEVTILCGPDGGRQVREHEIFRARSLRHRTEIGGRALTIIVRLR